MRNLMPITRPMGAADLTQAAEDAGRYALALSDLSRAVAAYEAATGSAIAVVDADKVVMVEFDLAADPDETVFGSLDKTFRRAVEDYGSMEQALIYAATEAKQDPELLDAMYPQPVPEAGTIPEAEKAGAQAVSELVADPAVRLAVARARLDALDAGKLPMELAGIKGADPVFEDPAPASIIKKADNALPTWQGKTIPADLRDAVQHLAEIGTSGPKWGFQQDLDMIERAIDGQNEKLIADVMEFSQSHIRQRFNKLVDRTHGQGNRFTREQIRDALSWMLVQDEMPAF